MTVLELASELPGHPTLMLSRFSSPGGAAGGTTVLLLHRTGRPTTSTLKEGAQGSGVFSDLLYARIMGWKPRAWRRWLKDFWQTLGELPAAGSEGTGLEGKAGLHLADGFYWLCARAAEVLPPWNMVSSPAGKSSAPPHGGDVVVAGRAPLRKNLLRLYIHGQVFLKAPPSGQRPGDGRSMEPVAHQRGVGYRRCLPRPSSARAFPDRLYDLVPCGWAFGPQGTGSFRRWRLTTGRWTGDISALLCAVARFVRGDRRVFDPPAAAAEHCRTGSGFLDGEESGAALGARPIFLFALSAPVQSSDDTEEACSGAAGRGCAAVRPTSPAQLGPGGRRSTAQHEPCATGAPRLRIWAEQPRRFGGN